MDGVGTLNKVVTGKCGKNCRLCPAFQERVDITTDRALKLITIDMQQGPAKGSASSFFKSGWTSNR